MCFQFLNIIFTCNMTHWSPGKCRSKPHRTPVGMFEIKKEKGRTKDAKIDKDMEKLQHCYSVVGNVNWCSNSGKQNGVTSKIKTELTYDPSVQILGKMLKEA